MYYAFNCNEYNTKTSTNTNTNTNTLNFLVRFLASIFLLATGKAFRAEKCVQYGLQYNSNTSLHWGFRMVEKVFLKSQKFQEDIALSLQKFRADGDFSDVTLLCEDGEKFEAHRVILASLSPVFESIFKRNVHHPLLYMRGVNSSLVGQVLLFLYQGNVEVQEDQLNEFLALAKEFKVKGLVEKPDTTAVFVPETSEHH